MDRRRHKALPPSRKGRTGPARSPSLRRRRSAQPHSGGLAGRPRSVTLSWLPRRRSPRRANRTRSGRSRRRASRSRPSRSPCFSYTRDPPARGRGRCTGLRPRCHHHPRRGVERPRRGLQRRTPRRTRALRGSTAGGMESYVPPGNARAKQPRSRVSRVSPCRGETTRDQRQHSCRAADESARLFAELLELDLPGQHGEEHGVDEGVGERVERGAKRGASRGHEAAN
jgi:hypothetical protein